MGGCFFESSVVWCVCGITHSLYQLHFCPWQSSSSKGATQLFHFIFNFPFVLDWVGERHDILIISYPIWEIDSAMLVQSLLYMISALVALTAVSSTPLDDYVWTPDAAYGWKDMVSLKAISKKQILDLIFNMWIVGQFIGS